MKLFLIIVALFVIAQIELISLKLTDIIAWSWWIVLSPIIVVALVGLGILIAAIIFSNSFRL